MPVVLSNPRETEEFTINKELPLPTQLNYGFTCQKSRRNMIDSSKRNLTLLESSKSVTNVSSICQNLRISMKTPTQSQLSSVLIKHEVSLSQKYSLIIEIVNNRLIQRVYVHQRFLSTKSTQNNSTADIIINTHVTDALQQVLTNSSSLKNFLFQVPSLVSFNQLIRKLVLREECCILKGGGCGTSRQSIDGIQEAIKKEKGNKKKTENLEDIILGEEGVEGNEEVEVSNLAQEMGKLEDLLYNSRTSIANRVQKYERYLIKLFEIYLQYSFLASKQSSIETKDSIAAQKKKLTECYTLFEAQKQRQPCMNVLFYMRMIVNLKDSQIPSEIRTANEFIQLIQLVKSGVSTIYQAGQSAAQLINGNLDKISDILVFGKQVLGLIEDYKVKTLFASLVKIQIERIQILSNTNNNTQKNQNNKNTQYPEIEFYVKKCNQLIVENKQELEEDVTIYFLIKLTSIFTEILENQKKLIQESKKESTTTVQTINPLPPASASAAVNTTPSNVTPGINTEDQLKNELKKLDEPNKKDAKSQEASKLDFFNVDNPDLKQFVKNLILEFEDRDFTDTFKSLLNMHISNEYLRFASLQNQMLLRQIIYLKYGDSALNSPVYKSLLLNIFKFYMSESQQNVKVLLYYDLPFHRMVEYGQEELLRESKEKVNEAINVANQLVIGSHKIGKEFFKEYLDYSRNWKQYVSKITNAVDQIENVIHNIDDISNQIKENLKVANEIIQIFK